MTEQIYELPKTYSPREVEARLYAWWEGSGFFLPDQPLTDRSRRPFVISMPPPNVTGELHLGHAMTAALEDLMIRWHRMLGDPSLWVPGEDHAGIATQNVVEKELAREGKTRHGLGREAFEARVWEWVRKYRHVIVDQHKRLGVSCDWSRQRFTLDDGLARAVRVAFVRLYERGLIYRGSYLINWCPRCETALSDLEVEHGEEEGRLWTVRYPLAGDRWKGWKPAHPWGSGRWAEGAPGFISVATTRPETILGDTAVAVNPSDERHGGLVGRTALLPALGRQLPIIADARVSMEFGTGAVKITPGHDPNDYEIGRDHGLATVSIMEPDATLNEEAGPYAALDRFQARRRLVEDLHKEGLLVKEEAHTHAPGRCQRCDTLVEPLISTQWFMHTKPLAEPAIEAVRQARTRIIPERFEKVYFHWMENIRDWCISRQLWWGHRIPVWYCGDCGQMTVALEDPSRCADCGSKAIEQDPDVLDTWFSSGLWPFSTLGWPEDTEDLGRFYPTTVMETGYDILFFWVARMMMLGLALTDRAPFETVYLHGLIRDPEGGKMSKSRGNVVDPLELIDRFGADALRFYLVTSSTPGQDMKISEERLEGARNFANKLWNAARFVLGNLDAEPPAVDRPWEAPDLSLPDRWILSRYRAIAAEVTRLLEAFQFGEAGRRLNDFLWSEFCDWYLEACKVQIQAGGRRAHNARVILVHVLEGSLRLLHPFMPFLTEEIWQHLRSGGDQASIMISAWPAAEDPARDERAEAEMAQLIDLVRGIRNARTEYGVEAGRRIAAAVAAGPLTPTLEAERELVAFFARIDPDRLRIAPALEPPRQAATVVAGPVVAYLPLAGMIDLEREVARLEGELERLEGEVGRSRARLENPDFRARAPAEVVAAHQSRLEELEMEARRVAERLGALR